MATENNYDVVIIGAGAAGLGSLLPAIGPLAEAAKRVGVAIGGVHGVA